MGRKNLQILAALLLCVAFFSCKKDEPSPAPLPPTSPKGVYVVCEGSLGNGNSSLSFYSKDSNQVYEDVYRAANGQPIGDVFQSMIAIDNHFFLCVNNSDKILVINRNTWKQEAAIQVPKPRYMLPVAAGKMYVSTLFSDKLYIVDPINYSVQGSVKMPGQNPEGMLLNGNTAFVCTWDTAYSKLSSLDISSDQLKTPIDLQGAAPQEVVKDKDGMLWVLTGNADKGKTPMLSRVNPETGVVLNTYTFPKGADVVRPTFNATGDTLYFIEVNYNGGTQYNGVYRMGIHDASLPQQPFLQAQQYQYFWALGIEPATGNIYIGDPKGFTQKGAVLVYQPDGTKLNEFKVGVGPGHFYFEQ